MVNLFYVFKSTLSIQKTSNQKIPAQGVIYSRFSGVQRRALVSHPVSFCLSLPNSAVSSESVSLRPLLYVVPPQRCTFSPPGSLDIVLSLGSSHFCLSRTWASPPYCHDLLPYPQQYYSAGSLAQPSGLLPLSALDSLCPATLASYL